MLLFSFSIISNWRPLKTENENNNTKTLKSYIWDYSPGVQVYIETNPGWLVQISCDTENK